MSTLGQEMDIERYHSIIRSRIKERAPIPLEEELITAYLEILQFRQLRKKQYLIQPGFPNKDQFYVVEGAFRTFFIDNEGKEQTILFAIEDWFISDAQSYLTGEPATLFVEALEDSTVAILPREAFEELCDRYPKWQKATRIYIMRGYAYMQKRMVANLQKSAEERYLDFVRDYREIEQRVPRYALASYLIMSQEYLSKIRKKLMS